MKNKDATSIKVSFKSVIITSEIDAHKIMDLAFANIPGYFFTTDMDASVIIVLRGRLKELMVKTEPSIY